MMFGAWGNPDHDDSIAHHPPRARRRHQLHRHRRRLLARRVRGDRRQGARRAAARRVVLATKVHGTMGDDPNQRGNSRRWIMRRSRTACAGCGTDWIDLYQIHRPDPDDRHRRDARRADRPRARGQGPLHRQLDVPGVEIVEAQWVAERAAASGSSASSRRTRSSCAASRPTCCRRVRALRHGRDPVEPARRRLAVGQVPQGRRRPTSHRASGSRALRPVAARRTSASSRRPTRSASSPRRPASR
jgi:hypothetical protein